MIIPNPEVEILLPVHNEGGSIEAVIREIHAEFSSKVAIQFIICEDGSIDNTKEVLRRLDEELPMKLMIATERKGYSRAVRDGMEALTAPYLLCLDSDGQCDPKDFWSFWEKRENYDMILGWRVNRADMAWRRIFSRSFYLFYQLFFHVPVNDPSCPYMLTKKGVVQRLLPELGEMKQGFWWEFVARVHRRGYSILELPIQHRDRLAGETQVYKLSKLPGIGWRHFVALFKIWHQTRKSS
jgi:dolichol-phosphate mannosyltransferase